MFDVVDEVRGVRGQIVRTDVDVAASRSVQVWLLLAVTGVGQGGALTAQTGGLAGHVEDEVNTLHPSSAPALLPALPCVLVTQEAGTQVSRRDLHLTTGRPGGTSSGSRAASACPDAGPLTLPVWGRGGSVRAGWDIILVRLA